jgi:[acyl-carrier-protein] S-malonyltransferase
MAADLADRFPAARETLDAVDEAVGFSLSALMASGPEEQLLRTDNAQPAILAHSAVVLAVIRPALDEIVAAAGHSLGEYSAYVASGSLDPAHAAVLVRERGRLMLEAGAARPGAMAAVLGLSAEQVTTACLEGSSETHVVVPANLNAPDQTVISGDPEAVEATSARCRLAGAKRVIPLKVSGAFHSPLMESALPGLRAALASVPFGDPQFPVVANANATQVRDAVEAVRLLADQLTAPVRWVESMHTLGRIDPQARFIEVGPGSALKGLLRRILPDALCITLGTTQEVEAFVE